MKRNALVRIFDFAVTLRLAAVSIVTLVSVLTGGCALAKTMECDEIQTVLAKPEGVTPYRLHEIPIDEGTVRILDADFDGDKKADEATLFCPGSGSQMPADPCILDINLSSGSSIQFSRSRISLMQLHSKVYVIATEVSAADISVPVRDVYAVDKKKDLQTLRIEVGEKERRRVVIYTELTESDYVALDVECLFRAGQVVSRRRYASAQLKVSQSGEPTAWRTFIPALTFP